MISFLKGYIEEKSEKSIFLDVNGVGYEIYMPTGSASMLPSVGEEVKIHTYLQISENGIGLYGFLTKDELNVFKLLITVSGIGPKLGLGILSSIGADELRAAVLSEDADRLAAAPGIGKKTAGRLVIELKDKIMALNVAFSEEFVANTVSSKQSESEEAKKLRENALQVLVALGYAEKEAARAVKEVEITDGMTDDEMVRLSLRQLG